MGVGVFMRNESAPGRRPSLILVFPYMQRGLPCLCDEVLAPSGRRMDRRKSAALLCSGFAAPYEKRCGGRCGSGFRRVPMSVQRIAPNEHPYARSPGRVVLPTDVSRASLKGTRKVQFDRSHGPPWECRSRSAVTPADEHGTTSESTMAVCWVCW